MMQDIYYYAELLAIAFFAALVFLGTRYILGYHMGFVGYIFDRNRPIGKRLLAFAGIVLLVFMVFIVIIVIKGRPSNW
jgi:hypothetical protein